MSKQTTPNTEFYFDTPEYFRREIEEQRQLAESISNDIAAINQLLHKLTTKAISKVKAFRVDAFNTRDAA